MPARETFHMNGAPSDDDRMGHEVDCRHRGRREEHEADEPVLKVREERQPKDIEAQVLTEERIAAPEGHCILVQQILLPVRRAAESRQQGESERGPTGYLGKARSQRFGEAQKQEALDGAPVAGWLMATGEHEVRKEDHEEDGTEGSADQDLGRQKGDEDRLIADFPEPEPIDIEGEGIREGEHQQEEENDN